MYSTSPKNIAYQNTGQDRDHNIYTEEFLGGADTFIYINNELYTDISAIQYTIREQQKPIYGYASRLYDDVATGIRIVQGMIKVPVRNTKTNESLTFDSASELQTYLTTNGQSNGQSIPNWLYDYTLPNSSEEYGKYGTASAKIYEIQNKLKEEGYNVNPSGTIDASTKIAILKYRRANGENISLNDLDNILMDGV